jgi:DNA-binding NarL/FixJ family response regulator
MTHREQQGEHHELLMALREAEQNYKAAVTPYRRLLRQAKDAGLLRADLALCLLNAVNYLLADRDAYVSPQLGIEAAAVPKERGRFASLSSRELEIVILLAEGLRTKEIAARVHLSPKTVDTHKANAMRKLGARNLADLLRLLISRENVE